MAPLRPANRLPTPYRADSVVGAPSARHRKRMPASSAVADAARAVLGWDLLALGHRTRRGPVAERPPTELLPPVRRQPARRVRTLRDEPRRVEVGVDDVVVLLDLREVDRVAEAGGLEQVAGVAPQR